MSGRDDEIEAAIARSEAALNAIDDWYGQPRRFAERATAEQREWRRRMQDELGRGSGSSDRVAAEPRLAKVVPFRPRGAAERERASGGGSSSTVPAR